MSRFLNIRVIAETQAYDEEKLAGTWPGLCTLAWPGWMFELKLESLPLKNKLPNIMGSSVEKALGKRVHGVRELAESLSDALHFLGLPEPLVLLLKEPVEKLAETNRKLGKALADWNPQEARKLADELEDYLDKAEDTLSKF